MSQRLPIGGYQWVDESVIKRDFNTVSSILNLADDSDIGYILEVDLHYPAHLHDKHNDYPFCPEKRGIDGITQTDKLLLTFYDKKNYIVHYSMLKLALEHGLVLEKVHRVLQFNQSAWLKPYIDLNTAHRARATNDFEKNFYKLLNNAVYGKTMENLRLRTDVRMVDKWDGSGTVNASNLIAQPNFKKCVIYGESLVTIELNHSSILMNKPIIIGMCVLELSKVLMYKFLYNYLKPKYGQNIQVVYTDTDSFILEIKTNNVYSDIRDEPDMFDTWDYPENNIYGIRRHNKKVPGKFSDELKGEIVTEVVGLRSKCYAVRTKFDKKKGGIQKNVMKKAKGIKKNVLSNQISFEDYHKCMKENCIELRKQYTIRSRDHELYTISMQKIALNPFDDKRYIIKPDGIDTLAWGHYKLDSETMDTEYRFVSDIAKSMKGAMK